MDATGVLVRLLVKRNNFTEKTNDANNEFSNNSGNLFSSCDN